MSKAPSGKQGGCRRGIYLAKGALGFKFKVCVIWADIPDLLHLGDWVLAHENGLNFDSI